MEKIENANSTSSKEKWKRLIFEDKEDIVSFRFGKVKAFESIQDIFEYCLKEGCIDTYYYFRYQEEWEKFSREIEINKELFLSPWFDVYRCDYRGCPSFERKSRIRKIHIPYDKVFQNFITTFKTFCSVLSRFEYLLVIRVNNEIE